jgi:hypothetical protein
MLYSNDPQSAITLQQLGRRHVSVLFHERARDTSFPGYEAKPFARTNEPTDLLPEDEKQKGFNSGGAVGRGLCSELVGDG